MDFSIGELARRAKVKVPTIRYYEQIGLLPPRRVRKASSDATTQATPLGSTSSATPASWASRWAPFTSCWR